MFILRNTCKLPSILSRESLESREFLKHGLCIPIIKAILSNSGKKWRWIFFVQVHGDWGDISPFSCLHIGNFSVRLLTWRLDAVACTKCPPTDKRDILGEVELNVELKMLRLLFVLSPFDSNSRSASFPPRSTMLLTSFDGRVFCLWVRSSISGVIMELKAFSKIFGFMCDTIIGSLIPDIIVKHVGFNINLEAHCLHTFECLQGCHVYKTWNILIIENGTYK